MPFQLAVLLAVAFTLRVASFGHPNMDADETFYFLVGQAMHHGALPYVDVWDRKPLGLFIIYWAIAGISTSVVAYQVAATLFAAGTAAVIARIGTRIAGAQGGLLAGIAYLFMLAPFWGYGAQAQIFYNLFVAAAALLTIQSLPDLRQGVVPRRVYLAMALGGIAITVKQTALFESAFFGIVVVGALWRAKMPPARLAKVAALCALLGAAPTLAISGYYAAVGHWPEYWHAMVTSNLTKQLSTPITMAARMVTNLLKLDPLLCVAAIGLLLPRTGNRPYAERWFIGCWIAVAVIGFAVVPNFYQHYVLPLLVPLCVAAAPFFSRRWLGPIGAITIALLSYHWFKPFTFAYTRSAEFANESMARSIREHDMGRGLLVYDGPILLHSFAKKEFMSPLVMPNHINYGIEKNVSHLNTMAEVQRMLHERPGAVVISAQIRNHPANWETRHLVLDYINHNCRLVDSQNSWEMTNFDIILVYGDCSPPRQPHP